MTAIEENPQRIGTFRKWLWWNNSIEAPSALYSLLFTWLKIGGRATIYNFQVYSATLETYVSLASLPLEDYHSLSAIWYRSRAADSNGAITLKRVDVQKKRTGWMVTNGIPKCTGSVGVLPSQEERASIGGGYIVIPQPLETLRLAPQALRRFRRKEKSAGFCVPWKVEVRGQEWLSWGGAHVQLMHRVVLNHWISGPSSSWTPSHSAAVLGWCGKLKRRNTIWLDNSATTAHTSPYWTKMNNQSHNTFSHWLFSSVEKDYHEDFPNKTLFSMGRVATDDAVGDWQAKEGEPPGGT